LFDEFFEKLINKNILSKKMDFDDIALLKIFSFLSLKHLKKCTVVNKKWNSLIGNLIKSRNVFLSETYIGGDKWKKFTRQGKEIMVIEKNDFIKEYQTFLTAYNFARAKVMLCFLTSDFYSLESIIFENGKPILNEMSDRNCFPVVKCRLVLSVTANTISNMMPEIMPYVKTLFVVGLSIFSNDLKNYHGNSIRQGKLGLEPCKPAISSLIFPDRPDSYRFEMRQVVNDLNAITRFCLLFLTT